MTDTVKKPSKKANYSAMLAILDTMENDGVTLDMDEISYDSLRDFINHEIELLDKKSAAAANRAAIKREEGDALRERVYNALSTEDYMTINEIVKALNDEDISAQMVTARLTQLAKAGQVEKDSVSVAASTEGGKSKKLSAYKRIG